MADQSRLQSSPLRGYASVLFGHFIPFPRTPSKRKLLSLLDPERICAVWVQALAEKAMVPGRRQIGNDLSGALVEGPVPEETGRKRIHTRAKYVRDLTLGEGSVQHGGFVDAGLARISHRWSTTSPQSSVLAALRSVGLLDVLHEYDCGGLGRKPCQDGLCGASLRQAMRNPG